MEMTLIECIRTDYRINATCGAERPPHRAALDLVALSMQLASDFKCSRSNRKSGPRAPPAGPRRVIISFTQIPPNDRKRRASPAKGGEPCDYWAERIKQLDNALARAKAAKTEVAQDGR